MELRRGILHMHTRDGVFLFLMRKLEALTDVCAAHTTIGLWRSTSNTADPRSAAVWRKGSLEYGSGSQFDEVHTWVQA